MMHGNEVQTSILAINMRDELRNNAFEFRRVRECGRGHLDHDGIAYPLRIVLEELLKGPELFNWIVSSCWTFGREKWERDGRMCPDDLCGDNT